MDSSPIVTFVVDKELEIANYLIGLSSYKRNKESGFPQMKNDFVEKLSLLTSYDEIRSEIEKHIEKYYRQKEKLQSLVIDINNEWQKIEKKFIEKLEKVHERPFPYNSIRGVLSCSHRFGYNIENLWFATDMLRNKFIAIDTATHELMHFMFHKYFDSVCIENGLSKNQMWDVKEAFTILLNSEFSGFRFQADQGYSPHAQLREIIQKVWQENHNFSETLVATINFIKK